MECLIAIGTWVAGKVADYTVAPVGHQLGYIFHYRRNVQNLKTELQKLNRKKKEMEDLLDAERRNGKEARDHVTVWLSEVGKISQKTEQLLGDENHTTINCTSRVSFPNLVQRYQLSRKAEKMGKSVSEIKGDISFDKIASRPILQSNFRNNEFINFDTRKEITRTIMEMLEDGNIKMIGVHGLPGAGKTTLVTEIAREASERKLINVHAVIIVSKTPDLKSIQETIAKRLGLTLDTNIISERALLLENRLKSEEKFLIILDDLWNDELNFKDLGILIESDDQKGCKILLTSRFERVLRDDFGVEKTLQVKLLSEDEAWDLFSRIVGDLVKNPDFQQHGNEIVKECACLPIAIATIAKLLKNRSLPFWRDILGKLQSSNLNIENMEGKVYSSIRLCYDYVSEEAKLLSLLCCLHEEDASISMEDLMRYGIGLDIFEGIRTLEKARDRVYSLVDELKDRCLLLEYDAMVGTVKMHDVIRDVVMSIGKERRIYRFSDGADVEDCKKRKTLEDSSQISLPNGYVSELVCESFEYKQLQLIWMGQKKSLDIISNNFFEKTKELRVLCFFSQDLEVLPPSFRLLQNLRTLHMNDCQVGDIASIGELKNLEILDLSESSIKELPTQIGQLTRLRILDLSRCLGFNVIHPNILSRLKRLEELMLLNFKNWDKDVEVGNGEIRNASLLELKDLVRLTHLELNIPYIRMLPKDLFSDKLKRYTIAIQFVGNIDVDVDADLWDRVSPSRVLAISKSNESIIFQEYGLETLLKRCDALYLSELQGPNNIVYELHKKVFPELKIFFLKNNDTIQYLINTMGQITCSSVFGSLEFLWLVNLTNLEKICHGELIVESFKRLSHIRVKECKRLKNLLPLSIATQLEKIQITDCEMMEEIFTHEIDDDDDDDDGEMAGEFPHLCSLELENLSKLRKFCSKLKKTNALQNQEEASILDSSMPFFNGKLVSLTTLEILKLSGCDFTKIWDEFQLSSTSFRNLTQLVVRRCDFMENLFSSAVAASLEQLYSLDVRNCRTMKEIMRRNESMDKMSFPKLNNLTLRNLPNLVSFSSSIFIEFPVLAKLEMEDCPAFKTFISDSSEQNSCTTMPSLFNEKAAFPSLNRVVIKGMDKLKMIWQYESAANSFCKLKDVTIGNCKNLMKIIPSGMQRRLRNVIHLQIYDCEMVEEVFEIQMSNNIEETNHVVVPAQLTHLSLDRLEKLKYVWSKDPQATLTYPNLEKVVGLQCPSLVSIFPPSIAKGLSQLKRLDIDSCGIEEIVAKEEGSVTTPSEFVFPQLGEMRLKKLPNLVSFYPGLHTSSWPLLTRLDVSGCMKVKLFALEFKENHRLSRHDTFPIQQPLFFTKISFPRLENVFPSAAIAASFEQLYSIEISKCKEMKEIISRDRSIGKMSFSKLNHLKLRDLSHLVRFSSEIFIEFPVLTELYIQDCPEFGTFISKSEENSCTTIPSLFNEKFVSFPILEKLELSGCHHFTIIWDDQDLQSSTSSFRKLKELLVKDCASLEYLFPSANVATSFVQLRSLEIRDCSNMIEIVRNREKMDKMDNMSFPNLVSLRIQNLPHLAAFSSEIYIDFPLLTELDIHGCPECSSFISKSEDEKLPSLFNEKVAFPSLKKLDIRSVGKPKIFMTADVFGELEVVEVACCNNLMKIFTSNIQRTLGSLRGLTIHECEMVEEVFEIQTSSVEEITHDTIPSQLISLSLMHLPKLEYVWGKDPRGTLTFTHLEDVQVWYCLSLKSMFPFSIAKGLSKLRKLLLYKCGIEKIVEAVGTIVPVPLEFVFPQLEEMKLEYLKNLVCFYPGLHTSSWPSLTSLVVEGCEKVKVLASELSSFQEKHVLHDHDSSPIPQPFIFTKFDPFPKLENLELFECNLEKIWDGELLPNSCSFRKLESLSVKSCGFLKNLFSSAEAANFIEFPLLTEISIEDCPKIKTFVSKSEEKDCTTMTSLFNDKVAFPSLLALEIEGLAELKMIWQYKLGSSDSFSKLEDVKVRNCNNLVQIFPSSMQRRLHNLDRLEISDCEMVEVVFEIQIMPYVEGTSNIIPSQLIHLSLVRLSELKHVWSKDPQGTLTFPHLQEATADSCPNLQSIFPPSIAKGLFQLEKLDIKYCGIQEIVAKYQVEEEILETEPPELISADSFCKLKVKVYGCDNLMRIFPWNMHKVLRNLTKLEILYCKMVEVVFEIQTSNVDEETQSGIVIPTQLVDLELHCLSNLKHVWSNDPRGALTFPKLERVKASECHSLKSIFPASVAKGLFQLKTLNISGCGIEYVVAKELENLPNLVMTANERMDRMSFPELEFLELEYLPNLLSFSSAIFIEFPLITELSIKGCPEFGSFISMSEDNSCTTVPSLFNKFVSFPILENLELSGCHHFTMIWDDQLPPSMMFTSQGQFTADFFGKLKEISVYNCNSLTKMFSYNVLRTLQNLSKLVISNCEMLEVVFEIQMSNDHHYETLEVTVPIHLLELNLSGLPNLKHVWGNDRRGTFTFPDLQMLSVHECQCLKILFPTSVAKNFLQLQILYVGNCGIEQIVAMEEGQNQKIPTFVFPQLNSLTLHNLPQLMSFYPGLHTLKWPLLRWLHVSSCMKAKDLSLKFLSFQQTSGLIHQHTSFQEPLFSIDEVTSSSQNEDLVGDQEECVGAHSRLSGLTLHDMPNLLHLREESSQPQTVFQNLIDLDILRCGRIKKLVSSSISFQNLVTLKVRQCHGMPNLLTSQTARSMSHLECLIIFNCKRMAEIIVDAEEGEDIEGEIVLARLKTLILDCLPSLTSFYSGKYMLGFPDLENVIVSRCFELLSFSKHGNIVSTPKLHKLVTVGDDHKEIDNINTIMTVNTPMDLNTIIPELWKSHPGTALQQLFCGTGYCGDCWLIWDLQPSRNLLAQKGDTY